MYIVKTLRAHEAKLLMQSLTGFYLRYAHMSSLITRYVGLYSVQTHSTLSSDIYCVVMLNNLPSFLDIHEIYDLKGSSVGRQSTIDQPMRRLKALKDLDFEFFYPEGIRIPHVIYQQLRRTIENDLDELRKIMITDFSLMLGVHHLDDCAYKRESIDGESRLEIRPQLGLSSLFAATSINPVLTTLSNDDEMTSQRTKISYEKLMESFSMKPLHLIACQQDETFQTNNVAKTLLGGQ
jgi:hypothetical protein